MSVCAKSNICFDFSVLNKKILPDYPNTIPNSKLLICPSSFKTSLTTTRRNEGATCLCWGGQSVIFSLLLTGNSLCAPLLNNDDYIPFTTFVCDEGPFAADCVFFACLLLSMEVLSVVQDGLRDTISGSKDGSSNRWWGAKQFRGLVLVNNFGRDLCYFLLDVD